MADGESGVDALGPWLHNIQVQCTCICTCIIYMYMYTCGGPGYIHVHVPSAIITCQILYACILVCMPTGQYRLIVQYTCNDVWYM